ncbi:MAG: glycosyltransferase family 4 protein [Methanobacteriales archaeon]
MKILFIHNTATWYRIPFFKKLDKLFDIRFFFTDFNIIGEIYDESYKKAIEELGGLNYKIGNSIKDLILELFADYDLIIGGSWDSKSELLKSLFIYTIGKLRNKKIILFSEEWDWGFPFKRKLINPIVRFFCILADAIVVPGSIHKKHFINMGVDPSKIFIMPNATTLKIGESKEDGKTVLYVGRLVKRKGVDYLIRAFKKLNDPDASLIIVGYGEEEKRLKELAQGSDNIIFKGKVPQDKLYKYYSKASVVVVPSISDEMGDPWVFVLNEAMLHGKPVIATDAVGGAYDLVKDSVNGFIIPEKDVNKLYKAMKRIIDNRELQEKMGNESKKIINEGFTYEKMVEGFKKAVEAVNQ